MTSSIKYIGFYGTPNSDRTFSPAATNKMDYICSSLLKGGNTVEIISPSWIDHPTSLIKFQAKSREKLENNTTLVLAPCLSSNINIIRNIGVVFNLLWLFFWLVFNVKKNERILLYHSPWLALPVLLAKKIKGFYLILEVEEVYADITSINRYFDKLEQKIFKMADAFLFATDLLKIRLATEKPCLVIYGVYEVQKTLAVPDNDGKIHLLYAGIIDFDKAGAFNAVSAAEFLPENYVLHLIGFGAIDALTTEIERVQARTKCKIIFDGSLSGTDYIAYCQKCHVGLSTQKMEGKYLESSFPSKILSYLSMGLNVVSCDIECVRKSKVGEVVQYYGIDEPRAIAKSILSIDLHIKNKELIAHLDDQFIIDVNLMFRK